MGHFDYVFIKISGEGVTQYICLQYIQSLSLLVKDLE